MGSTNITLEDIMNKIVSLESSVTANGKMIQKIDYRLIKLDKKVTGIEHRLGDIPYLIENLGEQIHELPFSTSIQGEISKQVISSEERIEKQFGARMIKIENDVKKIKTVVGI